MMAAVRDLVVSEIADISLIKLFKAVAEYRSTLVNFWPSLIITSLICVIVFVTLLKAESWLEKICAGFMQKPYNMNDPCLRKKRSAAISLKGLQSYLQDRYVMEENINQSTGISFYAVFQGHGGVLAADFAKRILVPNIYNKIIESIHGINNLKETKEFSAKHGPASSPSSDYTNRKSSGCYIRKTKSQSRIDSQVYASAEETEKIHRLLNQWIASRKGSTISTGPIAFPGSAPNYRNIDFGKIITREVLTFDEDFLQLSKLIGSEAGTNALMAIVHGKYLTVANIGNSRAVLLTASGTVVPISHDHKPDNIVEKERILDCGGYFSKAGNWKLFGSLETSRSLGSFPLKDKKMLVAEPDVLNINIEKYSPQFIIMGSSSLWDFFSNEDACCFVEDHLHEADYGVESLAYEAHIRGCTSNITIMVVTFFPENHS